MRVGRAQQRVIRLGVVSALVLTVTLAVVPAGAVPPAQRGARTPVPPVLPAGQSAVVASASAVASNAGQQMLLAGGNVVDAAIAVAAALNVAEPFASGIGGGGFILAHRADTNENLVLDCRETAPSAANRFYFVDPSTGQAYAQPNILESGGISVGLPGTVACWATALQLWGSMPLSTVLQPAINAANTGVPVGPYFRSQIIAESSRIALFPESANLFLPFTQPNTTATPLVQPQLGQTLQNLATFGPSYFYQTLASEIVCVVQTPPTPGPPPSLTPGPSPTMCPSPTPGASATPTAGPTPAVVSGRLCLADFANYRILQHAPQQTQYRGFNIVTHSAPSSGPIMLETLNLLSGFDLPGLGPNSPTSIHLINEALRVASADGSRWMGDPGVDLIPCSVLESPSYAATRSALITPTQANLTPIVAGSLTPTTPGGCEPTPVATLIPARPGAAPAPRAAVPSPADADDVRAGSSGGGSGRSPSSTTHLVVADSAGNAVSYTTTLALHFGSGMVVPGRGFLLNDTLTDFDSNPFLNSNDVVAASKRPWGTEAPTLIFDSNNQLRWVLGAAGSIWITPSVVQLIVDVVDWGMAPQDAVNRERFLPATGLENAPSVTPAAIQFETTATPPPPSPNPTVIAALQQMGHSILTLEPASSGLMIARTPGTGGLTGAADPRRDGATAVVPVTATSTPTIHPGTQTAIVQTATVQALTATATPTIHPLTATSIAATATIQALTTTATPTIHPGTQTAIVQTATVQALTATATPTLHPLTQTAIAQTATIQALTATATPTIHPLTATAIAATATIQALTATATPTIHPLTLTSVALTPTSTPPTSSGMAGVPCAGRIGGICTVSGAVTGTLTKTGSMAFTLTATGPPNAAVGRSPTVFIPTTRTVEIATCAPVSAGAQTTCTGTTVGDALQNAVVTIRFPLANGATVDVAGVVAGPGAQATPTATPLTVAQALALVQPSGQPGVPAASQVGQSVQVAGQVRGTGLVTSSMAWTITATVPAGVIAGTVPVAVFATTQGLQGFPCAAVTAGAATVACNGTTAGNALLGSTATVVFAAGVVATGTVAGPGVPPLLPPIGLPPPPPPPLVPLFPAELAPGGPVGIPPPGPLVPPVPPAPPGAAAGPDAALPDSAPSPTPAPSPQAPSAPNDEEPRPGALSGDGLPAE